MNESVDEISEQITAFLQEQNMEQKNLLRIRFLVEEILLDWQEQFSSDAACIVRLGVRLGRPFIRLEMPGSAFNPLEQGSDDYGAYRGRLMANMGLAPMYSYEGGAI